MRLLTRYVLREFLFPLSYCLMGFIGIYILFEMFGSFSRLMESELTWREILQYFAGYLSPYIMWLVPAALMLATLYTMWNFCRHSEIIAMRASGVSFFAIVKPLLFVALVMSGLVAWVNESYVPRHAQSAKLLRAARFDREQARRTEGIVYRNARENRVWTIQGDANDAGTRFTDIDITVDSDFGSRKQQITAEKAEYLDGEWWLTNAHVQFFNDKGEEIASQTPALESLTLRVFPELRERPSDILLQNRDWQYNSVHDKMRFVRTHRDITPDHHRACLYDAWAQALAPFACLVITLFAIPAGIASGRQSVFKGILGALGMFFSFYGLTIGCMVMVDKNFMPAIPAAFLPHIVFLILGFRAFHKQR